MLNFKGKDWSETQQELVTQDSLPVLQLPWNTFFLEGQGKKIARSEQSSLPLVLWNGTEFLPWGEVKTPSLIYSGPVMPLVSPETHILRPNVLHSWDPADTNPSQNTGHQKHHPLLKTNNIHHCDVSFGRTGMRPLIFLVERKVVSKLWFEICHFMNSKSVSSFSWKREFRDSDMVQVPSCLGEIGFFKVLCFD